MWRFKIRRWRSVDETFNVIACDAKTALQLVHDSDACDVLDGVRQVELSTENCIVKIIEQEEV
jgi:hypothetical protein